MILLFSGGIDSYIAWHYLNKPKTVYFNLNSRYSKKELHYVKNLIPNTIIDNSLDISDKEKGENAYVPFRNLLLAALAVKYSDTIVIAGIKGDNVSDKNPDIFTDMSTILSKMEKRNITITSPFWNMTKNDIIKWFLRNGGSEENLLNTVSCYSNDMKKYCGSCPSCFRKWVALKYNGINIPYFNNDIMDDYYRRAKNKELIPERNKEIIEVVDDYRN